MTSRQPLAVPPHPHLRDSNCLKLKILVVQQKASAFHCIHNILTSTLARDHPHLGNHQTAQLFHCQNKQSRLLQLKTAWRRPWPSCPFPVRQEELSGTLMHCIWNCTSKRVTTACLEEIANYCLPILSLSPPTPPVQHSSDHPGH